MLPPITHAVLFYQTHGYISLPVEKVFFLFWSEIMSAEAYSGPSYTSKVEQLIKLVHGFQATTFFPQIAPYYVLQGSECAYVPS